MSGRIIGFLIFIGFFVVLELYTFSGIRSLAAGHKFGKYFLYLFYAQIVVVAVALFNLFAGMQSGSMVRSASMNIWLGIVLTSVVTKIVFCSLLLMQDGGRMLGGAFNFVQAKLNGNAPDTYLPGRRQFLNQTALAVAGIPLISMFYGMMVGKYRYTVKNIQLVFKDLPKAFDGFKIVQISDIHSGSFDDKEAVKKGIDMINDQQADLLLFTGDLVNSEKDEINPYMDIFSELKAKHGKYAVLGNHDYYGYFGVPEAGKKAY